MNWSFGAGTPGQSRDAIPRPESILLICEMVPKNGDTLVAVGVGQLGAVATPAFIRDGNTKALVAFCDGHVDALDVEALTYNYGDPVDRCPWRWWRY